MIKNYIKLLTIIIIIISLANVSTVKAYTTMANELKQVDGLLISNVTTNSVDVSWKANVYTNYVRLNLIRTGDGVVEQTYMTSDEKFTIPLTPSTHYYIEVISYANEYDKSKPARTIQFNSLGELTYASQATYIGTCLFNPSELCVYYKPGINAVNTSVELHTKEGHLLDRIYGKTYAIFTDLTPNTEYYIYVIGVSSTDIMTISKRYDIKTMSETDYK